MDNNTNIIIPTTDKSRIDKQFDIFFEFYSDYISNDMKDRIKNHLQNICSFSWALGNSNGIKETLKTLSKVN